MDGELLSQTFVELTDTMVAGFDVIDFLHVLTDRSTQLLDVSAAGLLLADLAQAFVDGSEALPGLTTTTPAPRAPGRRTTSPRRPAAQAVDPARIRQAGTSFANQTVTGRQAVIEPSPSGP